MATDFVPISGGCRCDRLRFRITAPPLFTAACHCRGCQRMSASAFSLTVGVSSEAFQVLQGNPVIGGLHGDIRHYFCDWCLSWVFTRPAGMDDFINVRTTLLDDPSPFPPFVETCTSEKLPWVANQAPRSYAQFPAMEELPDLLRDYAVFSGRGGA
jgi:hypothetical protein